MENISVRWGKCAAEQATVQSFEEFERLLDYIQEITPYNRPILVTISGLHTHFIFIGIGSNDSILIFQNFQQEKEGWRIEYISSGDKDPSELYSFWLHGEYHSEFAGNYIISTSIARQTLQQYYNCHTLTPTIRWEVNGF